MLLGEIINSKNVQELDDDAILGEEISDELINELETPTSRNCECTYNFNSWLIMNDLEEIIHEMNLIIKSKDMKSLRKTIKNIRIGNRDYTKLNNLIKWNRDIVFHDYYSGVTKKYLIDGFKELLKLSNELDECIEL